MALSVGVSLVGTWEGSLWGSETVEQAAPAEGPGHDGGTLALSEDDFSALEERVMRAVDLVRRERTARGEAEHRVTEVEARIAQAETQLSERGARIDGLERDVKQLRAERDHIRQRVERLLKQLEALRCEAAEHAPETWLHYGRNLRSDVSSCRR